MRLLISAYACIPGRGSEPGIGWHWAMENAKAGNEVWCFTLSEGKQVIDEIVHQHPQLKIRIVYIDVPAWINYLYRFQPFVYVHYLVWQYKAAKAAKILDKEVNFNLIHHVTLASLQLGSGMWRLNKPMIFGPVGGGNFAPKAFKKYFSGAWFMEVFRKLISDILLKWSPDAIKTIRQSTLILAANNDTYRMAERAGAKNIELFMDTALSSDFFNDPINPIVHDNTLKILWVGRIFARKGLPLVLEALSQVDKKIPYHLTILGDGKQGYKVAKWLRDYRLEEHVTWRGQVPWSEVRKAYQEHDVFMFCSLRDSFGSQFLEAMACKLPIITLNHQGAGDHIPENAGIKVPVTEPTATIRKLAEAVEYMYSYPEERYKYGKNGNAFAMQQQWGHVIHQIALRYKEVLTSASHEAK